MISVLTVTPDDSTPAYEQLRRQLVDLFEGGQFVQGERLPPLRQLAGDLGFAVGTVARTYHELSKRPAWPGPVPTWRWDQGGCWAATLVGAGERARRLGELAVTFVAKVKGLGASEEETHEAVSRSLV